MTQRKRIGALILIPALAASAMASARTMPLLAEGEDTVSMTVLDQREDGEVVHTNFGPYDVEVDAVGHDSFHFVLQEAEHDAWVAACALGDTTRLLCSFYSLTGDEHAWLAVDARGDGLASGTLQGPGVTASVRADRAGWTVVDRGEKLAGVGLRGRDRVWFDRTADLGSQPLLAAAAGALLMFDELR